MPCASITEDNDTASLEKNGHTHFFVHFYRPRADLRFFLRHGYCENQSEYRHEVCNGLQHSDNDSMLYNQQLAPRRTIQIQQHECTH